MVSLFFSTSVWAQEQAGPFHPLDALTADEIVKVRETLRDNKLITEASRFAAITLLEAPKTSVKNWKHGLKFPRTALAIIRQDKRTYEARIDLQSDTKPDFKEVPGVNPTILDEEWTRARDALMLDARFLAAIKKRGYKDTKGITCTPNSAGYFPIENFGLRRILRSPCYDKLNMLHPAIMRPIEGITGVIDSETGDVVEVIDTGVVPLDPLPAPYGTKLPELDKAMLPVAMISPDGANYKISGNMNVEWGNWRFHVRGDKRAGFIISQVKFDDKKRLRDIAYQINVSEMFVPYMDPDANWNYRSFIDAGEFGLGTLLSKLQPDIDCPPTGELIDIILPNELGQPYPVPAAGCIFERANGDPAWRHASGGDRKVLGQPQIELVFRYIPTVGNYDYVIDTVFSPQGNITLRVGATGFDAVKGVASKTMADPSALKDTFYGSLVAPQTVAPFHDHYINYRIDLDIDGEKNSVLRDKFQPTKTEVQNPRKSIWTLQSEYIALEGPLVSDHNMHGESIRVESGSSNALGQKTSYWFSSGHQATSILDAADPPQSRAQFSANTLWFTQQKPEELWAAGTYANLSQKDLGLPKFSEDMAPLQNQDIVAWYTMGFRHVTRPEDFPILPTFWHEMTLRPAFFFDRDPSMTINPTALPEE